MSDAFDILHDALGQLWDSIYDAFTVRIWGDRIALWQLAIAFELFIWLVLGIVALAGYV